MFEIIQGPPGTGKSTTIRGIIKYRLPPKSKVLVTTTRNRALESVFEKLVDLKKKKIVVFGSQEKMSPQVKQYWIVTQVQKEPIFVTAKTALEVFLDSGEYDSEMFHQLKERVELAKESAKREICQRADIFLCTIAAIGKVPLWVQINTVVVDEAGCMEEITMASILLLKMKNVILIGDHKQLPPFVYSEIGLSQEQQLKGARTGRSLMERAIDAGAKFKVLRYQYRMHKAIMELVSTAFYDGGLRMGKIERRADGGVFWRNTAAAEEFEQSTGAYWNSEEVEACLSVLAFERSKHPAESAFYTKQVELITAAIKESGYENVSVLSVDASQGLESDCVIISCVRNNKERNIGFLSDSRRLNVAISRAREAVYIVGNFEFYKNSNNKDWSIICSKAVLINKT